MFSGGVKMYKSKDFILKDIVDINGNRIGLVKDIVMNFNGSYVEGFLISKNSVFNKKLCVLRKDIISYDKSLIVEKSVKCSYITLGSIKNMDVKDKNENILGTIDDIIFEKFSFKIKAYILSLGLIRNIYIGKRILLSNELILGENSLLYVNSSKNIRFLSLPHKIALIGED